MHTVSSSSEQFQFYVSDVCLQKVEQLVHIFTSLKSCKAVQPSLSNPQKVAHSLFWSNVNLACSTLLVYPAKNGPTTSRITTKVDQATFGKLNLSQSGLTFGLPIVNWGGHFWKPKSSPGGNFTMVQFCVTVKVPCLHRIDYIVECTLITLPTCD